MIHSILLIKKSILTENVIFNEYIRTSRQQLCQQCRLAHNRLQVFSLTFFSPKTGCCDNLLKIPKLNLNNRYSLKNVGLVTRRV